MTNSQKSASSRRRPRGGQRGERHHRAILTDHDVELIRQLREEHGLSFGAIALKFETPLSTIKSICWYKRR